MKRMKMIGIILLVALPLSVFAAGQKDAKPTNEVVHYRLATIQPPDSPVGKAALKFAELVKEKSAGTVLIDVYPASQLGNEKDIIDGVEMGTIDFTIAGTAEWAKRLKMMKIFEAPFVYRNRDHLVKFYGSDAGKEVLQELTKKTGVKSLGFLYYGTRDVTTGKVPAKTPAELNGVKLRCPDQPLYVQTVKAMGATPTPMAFSEVYLALQQGTVDGQENPPATIVTMKFHEVQKYLIKTEHIVAGVMIWTKDAFIAKMPKSRQDAIIAAANEASVWANEYSFKMEDEYLTKMGKEYGMTIIEPDKQAFMNAAQALLDTYEQEWGPGLLAKVRAVK
ncbi:MAG: TRAP transporter substrate-binding protein [Treponemataceae bacterium]